MPNRLTACEACGAPIRFTRTLKGKAMPLDAEPRDDGNVILVQVDGDTLARVITPTTPLLVTGDLPRYISHFATCPDAAKFRRKEGKRKR